jgi:Protein of unknown function (DUF2637)
LVGMTTVETPPAGNDYTSAQLRAAARDAYRTSVAQGIPLTGAELGRQFGLSPRWGRLRVAEVHAEVGSGNGHRPADQRPADTSADDPASSPVGTDGTCADMGHAEPEPAGRRVDAPRSAGRTASELRPSELWALEQTSVAATAMVRGITTLAVLAVAVVAALASYDHQRALAALAGEGWRAWLLPISVNGLIVAASMSVLVRRRAGMAAGALAWTSLLAGIGASLAANVAAAEATMVGRVVAAWPPVALLLAWELLTQVRAPVDRGEAA